jgi:glutaredoxin
LRALTSYILLLYVLLLKCSEAPKIDLPESKRIVLAELFSWARCPYCPYAAQALDSLQREYQDSLIVISYHRRVSEDTLSPIYVENRRAFYYESGGEPAVFFDGLGPVRTSDPNLNLPTYRNYIVNARTKKSPIQSNLAIRVLNETLLIRVSLLPAEVISSNNLNFFLHLIICEDSIKFIQSGASDSIFNHVMRAMIPDENGIPYTPVAQETTVYDLKYPLRPSWKLEHLTVVAFIQDHTTKEVIHSNKARVIGDDYRFHFECLTDTFQIISPFSNAEYKFSLANTGYRSDIYELKSIVLESVPGWNVILCVRGSCITPSMSVFDTLGIGERDSTISLTVFPNANPGTGIVALTVRSLSDTTKQKTLRVYSQVNTR